MNRENKRKQFQKGYYKTHGCSDIFTCKVCGRQVVPEGAGSSHRNHCPNCLSSLHVDIEPGDRESDCGGIMEPVSVWVRKTVNGLLFTAAGAAEAFLPTGWRRTTTQ